MKIENSFTVDAPIEQAWELLTDIPEIAPCLPGAKLTDHDGDEYSGGIKVKVGPVTSEFKGTAKFVEKDDVNHKAVIDGKGRDVRGAGNAQALITAQMTAEGDKTRVDIDTELKISGKVAQFGRGVMQDVSTKLLGQFAECLESKIGEPATIDGIAAASAEAAGGSAAGEAATTAADTATGAAGAATDSAAGVADTATGAAGAATGAATDAAGAVADKAGAMGGAAKAGMGAAIGGAGAAAAAGASKISGQSSDDDDDEEVLDLLDVAGGAVFKRFIPVAVVAVIVIVVIIILLAL